MSTRQKKSAPIILAVLGFLGVLYALNLRGIISFDPGRMGPLQNNNGSDAHRDLMKVRLEIDAPERSSQETPNCEVFIT